MSTTHKVAPADATWLQMDRPENPMMITGVLWFDTPVSYDEVLDVLRERLVDRYPKFAMRIQADSGGHLSWAPDPVFDLAAHVDVVALPAPGGKAMLERYVAQVMSTRLDPDRALWHAELIEDFEGGSALVVRLHHVIADGISLARVLLQLADDHEGDGPRDATARSTLAQAGRLLRRVWGDHGLFDLSRWTDLARFGTAGVAEVGHLLALPADPHTPLRGQLGVRKVAGWMSPIALDRVKAVGRSLRATVNDVLLTALAEALSDVLHAQDSGVEQVRTFIPVNLRPLDAPIPRELGNHFGLVVLGLPLGRMGPRQRLADMKARMDALKGGPQALVTFGILQGLAEAPDVVERGLVSFFAAKASLITTNVPGPTEHLWIKGHRVDGILCWVPQSAAVGLGVSILSYAGQVRVGVAGDAGILGDAQTLVEAYERAFEALEQAGR